MLLFRSEEHASHYLAARGMPRGATMTLDQQWRLAHIWYADRMSRDWRRRTPQEAEAVFRGLGLHGEFWRLTAPDTA